MDFKFYPARPGLRKVLREWQELALRYIWAQGEKGASTGKTCEAVNEALDPDKSISKASVIFFLERMANQGVLGYRSATGKGGRRRIYYPVMDERVYKKYLLKTVVASLMRDFPEETKEALNEL